MSHNSALKGRPWCTKGERKKEKRGRWRQTQTSGEMERERRKKEEKYTVREGNEIKGTERDKNRASFLSIILIHVICIKLYKNIEGADDISRRRECAG